MSDKTRRTVGSAALLLGLAALYFVCLLTALHAVGTDDGLYYSEQIKAGILPEAGISGDDMRMLDARLAGYLSGDEAALRQAPQGLQVCVAGAATQAWQDEVVSIPIFGQVQPAFNEREMTHMRDCFNLFALLRKVRSRLYAWVVLLAVGGAYLLKDRRRIREVAWLSPLALLLPLGALAAWAAADFNAAFSFFHKMLFTNDLWLLDPRTDLLIRICPQSMFMHMGMRIALWSLAALIGIPAIITILTILWPRGKEDNTWNNRDTRRASAQKQMTFGPWGTR